jgi:16S rRNA (guanine(527)-N(7))-methyltransferase RsmG
MKATALQPSPESMIRLFERSGLKLTQSQYRLFWIYHTLIRENENLDLTRIRNFENMVIKHYVDSALVTRLLDEIPSPLVDIGSGAGLPGIPIKILRPEVRLILAEGRKKRASFLDAAVRGLHLEGVDVFPHRVQGSFPHPIRGVITRAFETMVKTLERVAPFLPQGGRVIFMKGPQCEQEREEASLRMEGEYELERDLPYKIPHTPHERRLLIYCRRSTGTWISVAGVEKDSDMKIKEIISPVNETFKSFVKLTGAKGIRNQGLALFSGRKQVREVLASFPERCAGMILSDRHSLPLEITLPPMPIYRLKFELFKEVDISDTAQPILLVRIPEIPPWSPDEPAEGCTLCIPFQDPANVGAVIRSAAAFGAARVVLLKEAAHPFLPKSVRAAGSALLKVPLLEGPPLVQFHGGETPVVTLSPGGKDIRTYPFPPSFYLLPGLEGPGLPERMRATTVAIPMEREVESLNAAMAAGIALYLWRSSRG